MTEPRDEIHWTDDQDEVHAVRWVSLAGHPAPRRIEVADDTLDAGTACRWANDGVGILWAGDFQNARHLLQAMGRRLDKRVRQKRAPGPQADAGLQEIFHDQRRQQARRARVLGMLLLPFEADHAVALRRAPDVRLAARQAFGDVGEHYVASLRELLGAIGSREWRRKGVPVAALRASIHPHHGVFSPVRGEYVDLVAKAPLPPAALARGAIDIGTGTGVLAAVLARRGLQQVLATDVDDRALACATENLERLGLGRVRVEKADLFPQDESLRAGLIVCNPPWVPAQPSSRLDAAVYDPDSRMLRGFLAGLAARLAPGGEGWLVLSDLAEHLGLRSRDDLLRWIDEGNLRIAGRLDARPVHKRSTDAAEPLHAARSAEVTTLWRLSPKT